MEQDSLSVQRDKQEFRIVLWLISKFEIIKKQALISFFSLYPDCECSIFWCSFSVNRESEQRYQVWDGNY